METSLLNFVEQYGYLAIFGLVFLQELGVPNPVPNELILIFSGYLASIGTLSFWLVISTAIAADFIGTSVLFFIFRTFGHAIIRKKPRWLPIREEQIRKLSDLISRRDLWGIFIGRLLPYVRGYTSVAAGLIQMKSRFFLPIVFLSAITWSGGYVIVGKVLGAHWKDAFSATGGITRVVLTVIAAAFVLYLIRHIWRQMKRPSQNGTAPQQ